MPTLSHSFLVQLVQFQIWKQQLYLFNHSVGQRPLETTHKGAGIRCSFPLDDGRESLSRPVSHARRSPVERESTLLFMSAAKETHFNSQEMSQTKASTPAPQMFPPRLQQRNQEPDVREL